MLKMKQGPVSHQMKEHKEATRELQKKVRFQSQDNRCEASSKASKPALEEQDEYLAFFYPVNQLDGPKPSPTSGNKFVVGSV